MAAPGPRQKKRARRDARLAIGVRHSPAPGRHRSARPRPLLRPVPGIAARQRGARGHEARHRLSCMAAPPAPARHRRAHHSPGVHLGRCARLAPHYHVLPVHNEILGASAIAALHTRIHARLAAARRDFGLREPDQHRQPDPAPGPGRLLPDRRHPRPRPLTRVQQGHQRSGRHPLDTRPPCCHPRPRCRSRAD
jgi:hypothetical protein